jgi:ketosteroid isomerase-like protein
MSRENVELVRRATVAFNRRDVDGILEDWAPDAVLDWSNSRGFEAGVYRGRRQIRAFVQQFLGTFDEVRIELLDNPEEIEDGVVVVENVTYLRGRDGSRFRLEVRG